MKRGYAVFALVLAVACAISARDAAQLKADLLGIIPAGKKIRLAYIKAPAGSGFQAFPFLTGTNNVIYVVDSEDGQIRQLYPKTGAGTASLCNICLTADGQKVLFRNRSAGNSGWVNFDGSGSMTSVNCEMNEYWRNPDDGSDWMVLLNGNRVNIVTKAVVQANISGVGLGSAMTCMSDDGRYLMIQADPGGFGFYEIATKIFTSRAGGCQPSMRAGTPYEFNINPSGHGAMTVYSLTSTSAVRYETTTGAAAYVASKGQTGTCTDGNGQTQEGTRFTQHRDYATFFLSQSKANPILAKIGTQLQYVYIEDNLPSCFLVGDMDAVILPAVGVAENSRTAVGRLTSSGETFSLDGRRIRDPGACRNSGAFKGAAITRFENGAVAKIYR